MLKPHGMSSVLITGPKSMQEPVIRELHEMGVLHIVNHSKSELVDLVREHNPKMIITDKDMEREDIALEGIKEIREILKYETPVILMSGNMNGAEEKLKDLKDISYLIKPFNLSSFKETMKAAYPDYF